MEIAYKTPIHADLVQTRNRLGSTGSRSSPYSIGILAGAGRRAVSAFFHASGHIQTQRKKPITITSSIIIPSLRRCLRSSGLNAAQTRSLDCRRSNDCLMSPTGLYSSSLGDLSVSSLVRVRSRRLFGTIFLYCYGIIHENHSERSCQKRRRPPCGDERPM